ncbi:undifferentiated embryonic cell transcription factor 1-like [Cebus imitator]|uniref:undifferentiated embryonic cell transcription factor 1-like n=1 Tax=Cebus imitator TaxID=2715852 RepID=UPI000809FDB0|nr:undifferentiated embryonic cell transcription factor 1-like [Cebus imitator]
MPLWPLRPLSASHDPEPPAGDAPVTLPQRPVSPSALAGPLSLVSPGSAPRASWSARETELLLGALLLCALLRQALAPSRLVLGALAGQQVHRPRQGRRRHYRLLRVSFPQAQGQPPWPFDEYTPELTGLPGDHVRKLPRRRYRGPGRPRQGRGPAPSAPPPTRCQSGAAPLPAARSPHADPAWTPRFNRSPQRSADASRGPRSPEDRASPPRNAALLLTLGHLHRLLSILGQLRDQLRTLNQHVEQLRGAFCKTVSLAVGFVLGSAAAVGFILGNAAA